MKDEWRVGRVIMRPYVGKKKGEFKRTSNRHDYALKPTGRTALNALKDAGLDVIGVGKINDIFCGEELHRLTIQTVLCMACNRRLRFVKKSFMASAL